jgi:hypothetical protein
MKRDMHLSYHVPGDSAAFAAPAWYPCHSSSPVSRSWRAAVKDGSLRRVVFIGSVAKNFKFNKINRIFAA